MARTRETKVTLPCTYEQKAELELRAREKGLTIANYLRQLIGWPLEHQGTRKDLLSTKQSKLKKGGDNQI